MRSGIVRHEVCKIFRTLHWMRLGCVDSTYLVSLSILDTTTVVITFTDLN